MTIAFAERVVEEAGQYVALLDRRAQPLVKAMLGCVTDDEVGAGNQQVRWVNVADNTQVLYESSTFTADQDPGDSGWFNLPGAFTGLVAIEWQGKSTTATDDPIAKGYAIYVR